VLKRPVGDADVNAGGAATEGAMADGMVSEGMSQDSEMADGETDFVLEYTLSGTLFMVRRWLENPHGISAEKLLHLIYHSAIE